MVVLHKYIGIQSSGMRLGKKYRKIFIGNVTERNHLQHLEVVETIYILHLESKERLRIQPAQLFHFS